jgi:hypothetical protein
MKTITIDGVEYNWDQVAKEPEPLICTLDGAQYFLGPQAPVTMTWQEAVDWCKSLGEDYELPSRDVLLACFENKDIQRQFVAYYYWSSSEASTTGAWLQTFGNGFQSLNYKTSLNYVRAVRRVAL